MRKETPCCNMHLPMPMSMPFENPHCMCMPQYARAYVPIQYMTTVYSPIEGLKKGTIFPELDMPC